MQIIPEKFKSWYRLFFHLFSSKRAPDWPNWCLCQFSLKDYHPYTPIPGVREVLDPQDLQWLRPVVGIPNELLNELRPLLKGTNPSQAVTLKLEQKAVLQTIAAQITTGLTTRRDLTLPLDITIICGSKYLITAITQCKLIKTGEPPKDIRVLEWITPPLQPRRTIQEKVATLADLIQKRASGFCRLMEQILGRSGYLYRPRI